MQIYLYIYIYISCWIATQPHLLRSLSSTMWFVYIYIYGNVTANWSHHLSLYIYIF